MKKIKKQRRTPVLSTASLPDIVFMLLFFFMVTTVLREVDLKVLVKPPTATEVQKLEDRTLVSNIYIGPPINPIYGSEPMLQCKDDIVSMDEVREFIEKERERISKINPDLVKRLTTSLKVDTTVKMGIVTDVKQELRKSYALKLNYDTEQDPMR